MTSKKLIKTLEDYKSNNYIDCRSVDDYKLLPVEKRSKKVWFWPAPWYLLPRSLPIEGMEEILSKTGSWGRLYQFLKAEFPIQSFIRNDYKNLKIYRFIMHIVFKFDDLKYWIKYTIKPCRPHLLKAIPKRQYYDLPEVMREFLFACVVSLVEDEYEGKIPYYNLRNVSEYEKPMLIQWNKFYSELKKCYKYIKTDHEIFQKNLDMELDRIDKIKDSNKHRNYWKMEKKLDEMDKKWMKFIVSNSGSFWS